MNGRETVLMEEEQKMFLVSLRTAMLLRSLQKQMLELLLVQ